MSAPPAPLDALLGDVEEVDPFAPESEPVPSGASQIECPAEPRSPDRRPRIEIIREVGLPDDTAGLFVRLRPPRQPHVPVAVPAKPSLVDARPSLPKRVWLPLSLGGPVRLRLTISAAGVVTQITPRSAHPRSLEIVRSLRWEPAVCAGVPVESRRDLIIEPPRILKATRLVYPPAAIERGLSGEVSIRVSLSAGGAIESAVVVATSREPLLDRAALRAVKRWRFRPAFIDGVATASIVDLPPLQFRLAAR